MAVYVDELVRHPVIRDRQARRLGRLWCHLLADSLPELHAFARQLEMQRSWFQDGKYPHYDLVPARRLAALRAGATAVRRRDWVLHCQAALEPETPCSIREDGQHCNCWYDGEPCCACHAGSEEAARAGAREQDTG